MSEDADLYKYHYSGHAIGFNACGIFSLSDGSRLGRNIIIFGFDNNSSAYFYKKDILILGNGPMQGLHE